MCEAWDNQIKYKLLRKLHEDLMKDYIKALNNINKRIQDIELQHTKLHRKYS